MTIDYTNINYSFDDSINFKLTPQKKTTPKKKNKKTEGSRHQNQI